MNNESKFYQYAAQCLVPLEGLIEPHKGQAVADKIVSALVEATLEADRRTAELEAQREAQADYITWIDHRYHFAQNEILERERQLSIAAAYIGAGKDANVIVLRNEAGEFVDIVKPETSASMSDGIEPVKLAKL